ncbi:hypothetical protein [Streptomyces vinaceus]|uniref:hypothetical protein n=1 Tax=Streptomyces vinaceus TaxID=1960 RepID=UPI003674116E
MTDADTLFEEIAADLAPRGVTAGAMFGARALKSHGKVFACLKGAVLAVKPGRVFRIMAGPGRLAPRLAAFSSVADTPRRLSLRPCDARHQTPRPDPP